MSLSVEVDSQLQLEIYYPPTSLEYGSELVRQFHLDQVRSAGKKITGSDAWIDMVMRPSIEMAAIDRFRTNFLQSNPLMTPETASVEFHQLLTQYLRTQYLFCLAENGCNKHLQIQPDYQFTIHRDEQGIYVTPADISQFGDLAHKYVETNPRVGSGLLKIYHSYLESDDRSQTAIVSPSEEYESFGSNWDVINVMRRTDGSPKSAIAEGKYLICKRKLTITERRFLHNLFFDLAKSSLTLKQALRLSREELISRISTSQLNINQPAPPNLTEHQLLVTFPNSFSGNQNGDLFSLACDLNQIFETRFGETLFEDRDISMYPIIHELTDQYLPLLQTQLLSGQLDKYRHTIRQMIYHCQALWATNHSSPLPESNSLSPHHWLNEYSVEHLNLLISGAVFAGFEFSSGSDPWSLTNLETSTFDFSQSYGYEINHHCKVHGDYDGDYCPKCKSKSND